MKARLTMKNTIDFKAAFEYVDCLTVSKYLNERKPSVDYLH